MRWRLFYLRKTVARLIAEATLSAIEMSADARARQRERLERSQQENRELRARNRTLEDESFARLRRVEAQLDSTDPYTISRRAAESANAESSELVGALLEKQRLVANGMIVPPELDAIIARGSRTWSR